MNRSRALFVVLACTLFCGADERAAPLIGTWEIRDLYCRECQVLDRSDVGLRIHFTASTLDDPLSGGCDRRVGFRSLTPSQEVERSWREHVKPAWIGPTSMATEIDFLMVTCDGLDFVLLGALPNRQLVYLTEGELSFLLEPVAGGDVEAPRGESDGERNEAGAP